MLQHNQSEETFIDQLRLYFALIDISTLPLLQISLYDMLRALCAVLILARRRRRRTALDDEM
jgi:hypothetical protein